MNWTGPRPLRALHGLLGIALLVAAGWALLERPHEDGAGALGSLGMPVRDAMRVDPASGDRSWTFGVPLCLAFGDIPPVLEGVRPMNEVGDGYRYLGSRIRTFTRSEDDGPVISVEGWPPPADVVPDKLSPIAGYEVSSPCVANSATGPYTELLLGFERIGSEGGGWAGIYLDYAIGGARKVLRISHDMLICGSEVSCGIPTGESD